ncbi:hypothetical protein [Paenarthrobacter ureafaciens]|uniref:hypothetical protein n=1 Tax=Paenarthrobacter ureafaciens TaxID=37931 RepID=UPI0009AE2AD1|nr:hypothetical protein [Paenarthrobacter ureafaciens]GLU58565.1 hypothetical protein Pure01_10780 [Paenarthrobacter ureafaciens]GLU61810.1 hypothetical protein Pure02_00600 [Paenarthrobacter ureafaciens]GLU66084.1 hypothetical protein Pure03_00600 [Paenarthrobacter ureafaciens]GLU71592.1 hypothetical protein Pure04_13070 [Paenarthrobacter ureafaciens]GLU74621.1 hypothetical protein Pure05_00610 [Paenarthrobacter ureafaciens]
MANNWAWVHVANLRGPQGIQGPPGDASAWKASTPYLAGQTVISPTGDVVSAKVGFTSGATYDDANWNIVNKPRKVPNGTDWNTVLSLGTYWLDSFTNSNTMTNLPPITGGFAGTIEVAPVTATRVMQRATEYATTNPGKVWVRISTTGGSFTTWEPLSSLITVLSTGADLNTLTTPGKYRTETSTIAQSTLNNPGVSNPFTVEVTRISNTNGVYLQVLTEYGASGPIISRRLSVGGNFQTWITDVPTSGTRTALDAWGDSLTEGGGLGETWATAEAWPARAATLLSGTTVTNRGRSGDTTDEILIRMGVHQIYFTVTGGSIPASGSVAVVTKFKSFIPRDRNYSGSLNGINGNLSFAFATNTWTFTRSASGTAVPVSGSVLFVSGQALTRSTPFVFWGGRNDFGFLVNGLEGSMPQHIIANHRKVLDFLPAGEKRVLFFGPTLTTNDTVGTPGYTRVWDTINQMKYLFPGTFYSVMDYLIDHALDDAGITKTAGDLSAITNREAPPSLFITGDTTHFRKEIADVIGRFFAAPLIAAKGFVN